MDKVGDITININSGDCFLTINDKPVRGEFMYRVIKANSWQFNKFMLIEIPIASDLQTIYCTSFRLRSKESTSFRSRSTT